MNLFTIARPYAVAAFDFAVQQKKVEEWQSMLVYIVKISQNKQINNLLSSRLRSNQISDIMIDICGNRLDCFFKNFIKIIAQNYRLLILPNVLKQFIHLRSIQENVVEIEVKSSYLLNCNQLKKIIICMEKKLSKKVKLNCKIDKSIKAGIVMRIGSNVIDSSLQNRLKCFKNIL